MVMRGAECRIYRKDKVFEAPLAQPWETDPGAGHPGIPALALARNTRAKSD